MSERTKRWRPLVGGISVGHKDITAGTLGCFVKDNNGNIYILSNNHVLANSNKGKIGDEILQPGPYDGGRIPNDVVGNLSNFIEIKFPESRCTLSKFIIDTLNFISKTFGRKTRFKIYSTELPENEVDCAIAKISVDYSNEILEIGKPKGSAKVNEGEEVYKSGRTTGLTKGIVVDDSASITVNYGENGEALFVNQILVQGDNVASGGDSGSVFLNEDGYVVGLLFAGSSDKKIAIANHIYKVEELLGVKVCTE